MNIEEGIIQLKKICKKYKNDREVMHVKADELIKQFLPDKIREEYERLEEEVGFWYA